MRGKREQLVRHRTQACAEKCMSSNSYSDSQLYMAINNLNFPIIEYTFLRRCLARKDEWMLTVCGTARELLGHSIHPPFPHMDRQNSVSLDIINFGARDWFAQSVRSVLLPTHCVEPPSLEFENACTRSNSWRIWTSSSAQLQDVTAEPTTGVDITHCCSSCPWYSTQTLARSVGSTSTAPISMHLSSDNHYWCVRFQLQTSTRLPLHFRAKTQKPFSYSALCHSAVNEYGGRCP